MKSAACLSLDSRCLPTSISWGAPIVGELLLAELVPLAIGIALNPPAVMAVVMLLSGTGSRRVAYAFTAGWLAGLVAIGMTVLLAENVGGMSGEPTVFGAMVKSVLGLVLVLLALKQWREARSTTEPKVPGWMRSLTELSASRAFVSAGLFAALNPKTLAFNAAAAISIAEHTDSPAEQFALVLAFTLLGSITLIAPLAIALVAPTWSTVRLASLEEWLTANGGIVTAAIILVIGAVLFISGAQTALGL